MKTMRAMAIGACIMLVATGVSHAQTLNLGGSSWAGGTGTFGGTTAGGALFLSGMPSGAFYGTAQPDANTFMLAFTNASSPAGTDFVASEFNLASTPLVAGTIVTLTLDGVLAVPDYVAFTGGDLLAYSYAGTTLSLTLTTVDPVASAEDPTGATLGSAFGLVLVSGTGNNFGGTVFRTDTYWNDVGPLANYAGTDFVAALNVEGQNGVTATFNAYLPVAFLNSMGIFAPEDCEAFLQKSSGSGLPLGITREVHTPVNPGFANEGTVWTYGGASGLNFDGTAGFDDYVLATYGNDSWSDGNIGITVVPEPATGALLLGLGALFWAARRRR